MANILLFTPDLCINGYNPRGFSGFCFIVGELASELNDIANIEVFPQHALLKKDDEKLSKIAKFKMSSFKFSFIPNIYFTLKGMFFVYDLHIFRIRHTLKILYLFSQIGRMTKYLKSSDVQIVNIHGATTDSYPFYIASKIAKRKVVVTLHGLNSYSDTIVCDRFEKGFERFFISKLYVNGDNISVISSGIKNKISDLFPDESRIAVIPNGSSLSRMSDNKKDENSDCKLVTIVGTINANKNQIALVNALNRNTSFDFGHKVSFVFIGGGNTYMIQGTSIGMNYDVKITGLLSQRELVSYYRRASLNILLSFEEGFGLPVIESGMFGIPTLCYDSIDALLDLYDPNCIELLHERSDISLLCGIKKALNKTWNNEYIKKYYKKFSLENMALMYKGLYSSIL